MGGLRLGMMAQNPSEATPQTWTAWLDVVFLGNPLWAYVLAAAIGIGVYLLLWRVRRMLHTRLDRIASRTATRVDDYARDALGSVRHWFALAVAVWAASRVLALPERLASVIQGVAIVAMAVQALIALNVVVSDAVSFYVARARGQDGQPSPEVASSAGVVKFVILVVVSAIVVLFALDNIGVDITAMVASLGIGGIAVALAVQSVLGDLFSSLSIVLDKPFVVGDFIIVGDKMGTVEKIGLKTTRVRALSGEQLIFSNSDLLGSRIQNYKRMQQRRVVMGFGVTYQTPKEAVRAIPGAISEIIRGIEGTQLDRAHFAKFGASSLDFEVVYLVLSAEFNVYMDIQQKINLALMERLETMGVEFAYPTQTVFLAGPGDDDGPERASGRRERQVMGE